MTNFTGPRTISISDLVYKWVAEEMKDAPPALVALAEEIADHRISQLTPAQLRKMADDRESGEQ